MQVHILVVLKRKQIARRYTNGHTFVKFGQYLCVHALRVAILIRHEGLLQIFIKLFKSNHIQKIKIQIGSTQQNTINKPVKLHILTINMSLIFTSSVGSGHMRARWWPRASKLRRPQFV
ncbi:unnamed protein product [Prunus brigantina]